MKIKEISAGVKISRNYNSYSLNLIADIENSENPEIVGKILIDKARDIILKKILGNTDLNSEENFSEIEVGAAWLSRESGKLSVQYSKKGAWKDVKIEELEVTEGGYIQRTDKGIFVFRKIPKEKRKNRKMPVFRVYKLGDENHEKE